jgi:hypothetical protein
LVNGRAQRLGSGFDLRGAPVISSDGAIAVQSLDFESDSPLASGRIAVVSESGDERTIVEREGVVGLDVIGFSADGSNVYYAETDANGETALFEVGVDGAGRDELARSRDFIEFVSWEVGPDEIAGMMLGDLGGQPTRKLVAIGLSGAGRGGVREVDSAGVSPAFRGAALTYGRTGGSLPPGVVMPDDGGSIFPGGASTGFDAPIVWSPDGGLLAALSFAQYPPVDQGEPVVITAEGRRITVPGRGEVTLLGWR